MTDKYKFEFFVDGITRKVADDILDIITSIVELLGAELGGGFSEDDDGEEESK